MKNTMRRLFMAARRHKALPIAGFGLLILAGSVHPAMANATGTVIQFSSAQTAINDVINFATGPVAKIIAVLAIITGAVAFAQGREVNEGLRTLGVVGICCGLLLGAGSMFGSLGSGAGI